MKVTLSPRAEKQLRRLHKIDQIAIAAKIRKLSKAGNLSGAEKLKGYRNIFRVRVGSFRIVLKKTKRELYVVLISHRKEIYTMLSRLF